MKPAFPAIVFALVLLLAGADAPRAQTGGPVLERLTMAAELLGGVYVLEKLCSTDAARMARDRFVEILNLAGPTAEQERALIDLFVAGGALEKESHTACDPGSRARAAELDTYASDTVREIREYLK